MSGSTTLKSNEDGTNKLGTGELAVRMNCVSRGAGRFFVMPHL